ncbi:hypothetical protein J5N97_018243 [Dioscorea zingiberensis]|uniref:RING-type domain-containing protein n=1 Tax=Dioscorea zingiberensis TaxID=325984 RepID=A0A9D5HH70_9LILI|nr:hypothetical protein J5N97_018243 [Dioscorea zingiberensis]
MSGEGSDSSAGDSDAGTICSICLDVIDRATGSRSTAKLRCGHEFHLDCIGSAFNFKGQQKCPNCGQVEEGNWRFANVQRRRNQHFGGSQPEHSLTGTLHHGDEILLGPSNLSHHNGSSNQAVVPTFSAGTAIPPTIIQNPDFPGIENYYCSSEYYGQASLPRIPISGANFQTLISCYVPRPVFGSTQSLSQAYRHHQNPYSGVARRRSSMLQTPAGWRTYYYPPFTYPHINFHTPLAAPIYHPPILWQSLQGTGHSFGSTQPLYQAYQHHQNPYSGVASRQSSMLQTPTEWRTYYYPFTYPHINYHTPLAAPIYYYPFTYPKRTGFLRPGPLMQTLMLSTFASDSTNTNTGHQQHVPQQSSSNASSSSSTRTLHEQDDSQSSSSGTNLQSSDSSNSI